jgi:purine-binding chemotaxis protein CheW
MTATTLPTHSKPPADAAAAAVGTGKQFITFKIDGYEFGVDIKSIWEVKGWVETEPLPDAPHDMLGVLNLRGIVIPIHDIRARFGHGGGAVETTNVIIIVSVADRQVGMLVDAVSDIITVTNKDLMPVPDMGNSGGQSVMTGLVNVNGRLVRLLDLTRMFGGHRETF